MAKSGDKVTIKKYANRRLYDTESSSYITLDRLAAMIREGRDFEVVDAKTGEDITHQVLTLARGQHLAEDDLTDFLARNAGIGQRGFDCDTPQLVRGGGSESAEEGADGGAARGGDDDIGHGRGLRICDLSQPSTHFALAKRHVCCGAGDGGLGSRKYRSV